MKALLPFLMICLGLFACQPKTKDYEKPATVVYKNIVVFLDLSDRISKHPDQVEKDLEVLNALLEFFGNRQRQFGYLLSKDRLTIQIVSQAGVAYSSFQFKDSFRLDMSVPGMNAPLFKEKTKQIKNCLSRLYIQAKKEAVLQGADWWSDMRDKVPDLLLPSDSNIQYDNKIILLSDGYLTLEKSIRSKRLPNTCMIESHLQLLRSSEDWRNVYEEKQMGLKSHAENNFQNLEMLVMEVQPEVPEINTHEMEMIRHFWKDWMEKMDVPFRMHITQNNPGQNKMLLADFLQ